MYDKNNIFAKIIRGDAPCGLVAESPHSMAFKDLHPEKRVHILVIPKGPYENIADFIESAPAAEQTDFWNLVLGVLDGAGVRTGFRMVANSGRKAGQSVPHFHIHILAD